MSHQTGIKANENLRQFFAKSKEGRIRMFKVVINDREELVLDAHREVDHADWKLDFNECVVKVVDQKSPCYIFFRLDERTNTGFSWLFISWSPDYATVKQKMLYAATKSTLKLEFGAGQIKDDLFGTATDDITLDGYLRHIKAQQAPAPLTNREEEMEMLRASENLARIHVDSKHKTLQGVMFPIDKAGLEKLNLLKHDKCEYLRFFIDIQNEKIVLDKAYDRFNVDTIQNEVPSDKGRFHLFRFNHIFDNEQFKSVVFVYSMPGFSCTVKERMLYSSCKSELLSYLKTNIGLDINKQFEISNPDEISYTIILDELHPKKLSDGLKFEKPKGPQSRGPRRVTRPTTTENNNSDF